MPAFDREEGLSRRKVLESWVGTPAEIKPA
jgi:hypothetical protein